MVWTLQLLPFQTSANDDSARIVVYVPTATQASAALHDTP
jgi:hypothetical protein